MLIVDDNLETLVSLFLTLKKEDFCNKIIIAKTAEAALEQLQKINFITSFATSSSRFIGPEP